MHIVFHWTLTTLHKKNSNPYFTVEKISGSSEDYTKVTQQGSGKDWIGAQAFQRPESIFLSKHLAKILGTLTPFTEFFLLTQEMLVREGGRAALRNQASCSAALVYIKAFSGYALFSNPGAPGGGKWEGYRWDVYAFYWTISLL